MTTNGTQLWSVELSKNYLVESLTFYYTGKLVAITPTDIKLDNCAKVFQTGRLSEVLKGRLPGEWESEYLGDGIVIRMATIGSFVPWPKKMKLPETI